MNILNFQWRRITSAFLVAAVATASQLAFAAADIAPAKHAGNTVLEKAGEVDLGNLIERWASEMDHVFTETKIQPKDTSNTVFKRLGINDRKFINYVNNIRPVRSNAFARLHIGRTVQARLTPEGKVLSVRILRPTDVLSKDISFYHVSRPTVKDRFTHGNKTVAFDVHAVAASGVISTTLEEAGRDAKIPANVLAQVKQQLGNKLDLKKDIAKNDSFSVVYERRQLDGADLGAGRLLAMEFYNKGNLIDAYWFEGDDVSGYFNSKGDSNEQTFIRMPTAARVTSAFNQVRRHPVTGKLRPHWGVDLGAPTGTPIYASSDGVIKYKRYQRRGYGYWLCVNHGNGYESIYAHMSRYAKGMAVGRKVKKGELIGYVGRTGLVTGPHLHYELKKDGKQINPMTAELPTEDGIAKESLVQYQVAIAPLKRQLALLGKLHLAQSTETVTTP